MAKEKQPVMDLEQGIKLTNFSDNEPPEMILDRTKENETGSGNVGRWSEGFRYPSAPNHGTAQKAAVVSATTKPDSCSESEIPGLWPSSVNNDYCCIYRVPNRLRKVNPEAYTPQMLLIGPLHHSKKAEALELSKTDLRYLDYMNMERHKKRYLKGIASTFGAQTVDEFIRIIERDEQFIRESYAESTDWIKSQEFVEMILHDAVFILRFFLTHTGTRRFNWKEDILFEEPCLVTTILEDLILLENQLPYALLEELFEPFLFQIQIEETFRDIMLQVFELEGKIEKDVKFRHFTDLYRRVRVVTLGLTEEHTSRVEAEPPKSIKSLHNADKLDSAGVDFVNVDKENDLSLVIDFEGGILKMPCFAADDNTERVMRNIMALEQCHYPLYAYVSNYITFLDFLIDTEQDVDLLVKRGQNTFTKDLAQNELISNDEHSYHYEISNTASHLTFKEVVKNWLGHHGSVAEMVNKLCLGLVDFGSHYYDIAETLNIHYNSPLNRSIATLRRVYFKDLWTGTATITAVFLLVLTLIGTVASVLQVTQNDNKSPPPPPPRGR